MAPLRGLQDPSHEKFAETKENANVPFLRIPLELRLLIYEYATREEKSIIPKQLAPRSNKFTSGIREKSSKDSKQKKMFISDLVQVSRQIYMELEHNPVFYRVNKFQFYEPALLLDFLVAITPERRAFLRHIVVSFNAWGTGTLLPRLDIYRSRWAVKSTEVIKPLAALLSRCKDLRHLQMRLFLRNEWSLDDVLREVIRHIGSDNPRHALWSSTCIQLVLTDRNGQGINLMATRARKSSAIIDLGMSPGTIDLIAEAKTALTSHKQRMKEEERNGNGFWDQYTDSQVLEAIAFSQVDFPGESRIEQDRFNSVAGTISTRTRHKCKKDSVDDNGVIQRAQSKYNTEGILAWDNITIKSLRWSESTIEVDVEKNWPYSYYSPRPADFVPERSWEPIEAIMSEGHIPEVFHYFQTLLHDIFKKPSLADRLQILRVHPTPQDVTTMALGLLVDNIDPDVSSRELRNLKNWKGNWASLQRRYKEKIDCDEEEAEKEALKEKEEEKQKEKVQQQASKKRKTTTSRSSKRAKRS
ncbi:hypothetical protein LQW54_008348 [Pestalotiopsis sp. IQ-011]